MLPILLGFFWFFVFWVFLVFVSDIIFFANVCSCDLPLPRFPFHCCCRSLYRAVGIDRHEQRDRQLGTADRRQQLACRESDRSYCSDGACHTDGFRLPVHACAKRHVCARVCVCVDAAPVWLLRRREAADMGFHGKSAAGWHDISVIHSGSCRGRMIYRTETCI